jgi:hypothetical protein
MASIVLPAGHATSPVPATKFGPFVTPTNDLYVMVFSGATNTTNGIPTPYRSQDGGATWTKMAAQGATAVERRGGGDAVYDSTNGVIYVTVLSLTFVVQIWKYTIATDAWARFDTGTGPTIVSDGAVGGSTMYPVLMVRRSDGTFVVGYNLGATSVVTYRTVSTAGAWGTATAVSSATTARWLRAMTVGASDRVHFLYSYNTADTTGKNFYHRSLSSANALDTQGSVGPALTNANRWPGLLYNASVGLVAGGFDDSFVYRSTSVANPTWTKDTGSIANYGGGLYGGGLHYSATKLRSFFRPNSGAGVYYSEASGLSWGASVSVTTTPGGSLTEAVNGAAYTFGGNTGVMLAYRGADQKIYTYFWFPDITPPISALVSETLTKVSAVVGFNSTDVAWSANEAIQAWQFRVVTNTADPVTAGTLIKQATGVSIAANTNQTTTITEAELAAASPAQGSKIIKLFVQDIAGNWST